MDNETISGGLQEDEGRVSSQASFQASGYEDSSWEVVGELIDTQEFIPMQVHVLSAQEEKYVDPMFANYGGIPEGKEAMRWHLPVDAAYRGPAGTAEDEEEQEPTVTLTEADLEVLRQEAFEAGKQEGIEGAVAENSENLEQMRSKIEQVLKDMHQQIDENLAAAEKNAAQLAVKIAEKIIGTAVEINPEYIVEIIHAAVKHSGTATIKSIRVSPEDLEFIQLVGIARDLKEYDGSWEFVADGTVRSGCIVETSAGQIDFQLEPAWERVREKVLRIAR